jgi:hypothetical protein
VRTLAAVLAVLLAVACGAPKIRLTRTSIATEGRPDGSVQSTYTFHLIMPTQGRHFDLHDFVLTDSTGRTYTPKSLGTQRSSDKPDEADVTFEIDHDVDLTELRVAEFRKELNTHSRSSRR